MSTLPPTVNSQHPRALLFRNAAEVLRLIKGVHRFSKGGFGESMGIAHANIIHACAKNRVVESVHTGIGNPLEPRGTPAGERVRAPASMALALFDETSRCRHPSPALRPLPHD